MLTFDFQDYLSAIAVHYAQDGQFYTPTDALLSLEVRSVEREEGKEKLVEQFPVLEGLRKYALEENREHVLLAGRPGSGKSTALRQLVVGLAAAPQPPILGEHELDNTVQSPQNWGFGGQIPVLVQLKADRPVPELIKAEFRRAKVKVELEQIDDWLLTDRLILLLDGVNEIPNDDLRRDLAQFREDNRTVPMIFTTRDLSLGGDLGIGKRLEMQPLSEGQLREFVGKYLPEQGEKLLGQLRDRLREIAETPLLLKMLCDVFGQTGAIPANKGELFRLFDREYEQFKGLPAVSADFRRFKSEILQHLAFVMMQGDESKPTEFWLTIARSQAERSIEQWLTGRVSDPGVRAKEWLEDLLEHHLLQVAADSRRVEFHHQLFQEYYAAEALLGMFADRHPDVVEPERFQHFYLNYLKWTESVAIVLSLMEDEKTAVDLVEQALDVDLMLGARLAGEVRSTFQEKTVKLVETSATAEWFKVGLLGSTKSEWSVMTLENTINKLNRLGQVKGKNSSRKQLYQIDPFALNYISRLEPLISNKVANSLCEIGSQKAIDLLIKTLHNSENEFMRMNCAQVLGSFKDEYVVQALVRALDDKYISVPWRAIDSLARISSHSSFLALFELVQIKSFFSEAALDTLLESSSNHARFFLDRLLKNGDVQVCSMIHNKLNEISSKQLSGIKDNREIERPRFCESLKIACEPQSIHRLQQKFLKSPGEPTIELAIQEIQVRYKFYNYKIFHSPPAKPQPTQQSPQATTINQYPNVTEVKIIEHIDNYHASPPRDSPP